MESKHREILIELGFEGVRGPTSEEIAEKLQASGILISSASVRHPYPVFIMQKGIPWPLSSGKGVTAMTTDDWSWHRETDLTPDERDKLIKAGFLDLSELGKSLGQTRH